MRLYVLQDNCHRHEDIPQADYLERVAEIEMDGGHVYHATLLQLERTYTGSKKRSGSYTTKRSRLG